MIDRQVRKHKWGERRKKELKKRKGIISYFEVNAHQELLGLKGLLKGEMHRQSRRKDGEKSNMEGERGENRKQEC